MLEELLPSTTSKAPGNSKLFGVEQFGYATVLEAKVDGHRPSITPQDVRKSQIFGNIIFFFRMVIIAPELS